MSDEQDSMNVATEMIETTIVDAISARGAALDILVPDPHQRNVVLMTAISIVAGRLCALTGNYDSAMRTLQRVVRDNRELFIRVAEEARARKAR
jgi:hypothetical protein